jgi:hypothetical protein
MYGSLELKSLIDQRHEEALQQAQTRRLAKLAQANRRPRFRWAQANPFWGSVLSLLHATGLSG